MSIIPSPDDYLTPYPENVAGGIEGEGDDGGWKYGTLTEVGVPVYTAGLTMRQTLVRDLLLAHMQHNAGTLLEQDVEVMDDIVESARYLADKIMEPAVPRSPKEIALNEVEGAFTGVNGTFTVSDDTGEYNMTVKGGVITGWKRALPPGRRKG